jgi:magnesium-protoporphyrin IX monomethyl ester (oxidative) cyclase
VFALIMKANPGLLSGHNRLWIRFFLLAVFSTMYVRDHMRPELHEAFGFEPTDYDLRVLKITSEITRQVFPFTLNLDDPRFLAGLDKLVAVAQASARAREAGGLGGMLRRAACSITGALTFARLYCLPTIDNRPPEHVRLVPGW